VSLTPRSISNFKKKKKKGKDKAGKKFIIYLIKNLSYAQQLPSGSRSAKQLPSGSR
jgi:hypothetical protein